MVAMHTHRHSPIALSFSQLHCVLINTVYLLTHDIALSFSQLHHVTMIKILLLFLGQHRIHICSSGGGLLINCCVSIHLHSIQDKKNGHQATD